MSAEADQLRRALFDIKSIVLSITATGIDKISPAAKSRQIERIVRIGDIAAKALAANPEPDMERSASMMAHVPPRPRS